MTDKTIECERKISCHAISSGVKLASYVRQCHSLGRSVHANSQHTLITRPHQGLLSEALPLHAFFGPPLPCIIPGCVDHDHVPLFYGNIQISRVVII